MLLSLFSELHFAGQGYLHSNQAQDNVSGMMPVWILKWMRRETLEAMVVIKLLVVRNGLRAQLFRRISKSRSYQATSVAQITSRISLSTQRIALSLQSISVSNRTSRTPNAMHCRRLTNFLKTKLETREVISVGPKTFRLEFGKLVHNCELTC